MKLTKEQLKVIKELNSGFYVWTNEGSNLKAWIGDERGNPIRNLRVRTVETLFNNKAIEIDDGDYPSGLFRYKLTK